MICVVDVGIGNLRSVTKALERVAAGQAIVRTADPSALRDAARVVLPGVGAFGDFMAALGRARIDTAVHDVVARGAPLLGVCVGMQALLDESEEFGRHPGLGLIPGRVTRFPQGDLPVPHAGWSPVTARGPDPVLGEAGWYYFVHSYRAEGVDDAHVAGTAEYLGTFPASIRRGQVRGVQFHPEKSQAAGLALLERFTRSVPAPTS